MTRVERRVPVPLSAPPERLAAFRAIANGFATAYLVVRAPVFLRLGDRDPAAFDPVGVLTWLDRPASAAVVSVWLIVTIAAGVASTVGWRHRMSSPLFAVGLLGVTTLRSSWGQLLHFENLIVLFALVIALSPAADAWSLDARRRRRAGMPKPVSPDPRYGHPLQIASVIVVTTYAIAGIAKLRYGGIGWLDGGTLRNHIASAAARLDLLGGTPAPLAELAVRAEVVLPAAAVFTVVVELAAPLALVDRRLRDLWVAATWLMHVGVLLTMAIGFPSPLFGVAFVPLFRLEIGVRRLWSWFESRWRAMTRAPTASAAAPGDGR